LLITWIVDRLISRWTDATEFSVFLRDDATSEQRGALEALIDESGVSAGREYVSKAQALTRFRRQFADLASLTDDLGDNPFPASIEVRVRPAADADGRANGLVAKVMTLPGVVDVRYDKEWIARLTGGLDGLRRVGLVLVLLMAIAASVTVAAVVRLSLFARREEIDIMRLVGSPTAFIRGPFVAEGLLQGGAGALAAVVLLWLGFVLVRSWAGGALTTLLDGSSLEFLPAGQLALLVATGMAVGAAGGFAGSRHAG
jgi:cell division transport system permease protein